MTYFLFDNENYIQQRVARFKEEIVTALLSVREEQVEEIKKNNLPYPYFVFSCKRINVYHFYK